MTDTTKIATIRVADKGDDWHGPIVEITTEDNMTLSVRLPLAPALAEADPVDRALASIVALADSANSERRARKDAPTSASARDRKDAEALEGQLEEGLEDTFPASDPVSTVITSTLPKRRESD